ncbi:Propeptide, PepSY amd peptidase M4 [Rubrobacter xylanophilus DSM 9941]|uniref:Propeptide, PepSY amd peptidase M4 n=1 Tax=Rubrobacter xylanophilus (strain DSM 9941 / JCM 11954 / NBRC 16129 / PRD-1) TaxID=266117 RepID=Q1ARP9_RUBXD|nr:PepSY domain-containing protein [Rubrobacter xylanophilus]ABG05929.1 Propeptide, PepSY amd peptidase M4 [Rubrobacter xylanophilus DSM 9941]
METRKAVALGVGAVLLFYAGAASVVYLATRDAGEARVEPAPRVSAGPERSADREPPAAPDGIPAEGAISREEAERAALENVSGTVVESGLDEEDGLLAYKVQILDREGTLHDLQLDARSGRVLRHEIEDTEDAVEMRSLLQRARIDRERAAEIARPAGSGRVVGVSLTDAGPYAAYEVELLDGGVPGEVLVNAENGEVLARGTGED